MKPQRPSAWKMAGRFALAYVAALVATGALGAGFDPLLAVWFPMGLAIIPGLHDRALPVGYIAYALLASLGIILRRRVFFYIFVLLLLLNISGCLVITHALKQSGW